jgi:Flp pilus assembly protein TadG
MTTNTPSLRKSRDERGAALVEMAMTLPLMLLVAIGIFEVGRAFQTWQILTNAAREGARVAVLPNMAQGAVDQRVRDYMQSGALPNFGSATVSVNNTATISIGAGTATASVVTVGYPFNFIVLNPVARLVVGSSQLGAAPFTMTASATMRNETQ